MYLNIPNSLTLFRIALMPVLVLVFYWPEFENQNVVLASIFFVGGMTDWFDGYLARVLNQQSDFGAFLDPVADKLSVSIALVLIVSAHPGAFVAIPAAVIIGRELTISALRELWAIGFMLYEEPIGWFSPLQFGYLLLYISAALTLWSMVTYLIAAWPSLKK